MQPGWVKLGRARKWTDDQRIALHYALCQIHSLVIFREVLILKLSIFITLKGCISQRVDRWWENGSTLPWVEMSLGPREMSLGPQEMSLGPPEMSLGPREISLNPREMYLGLCNTTSLFSAVYYIGKCGGPVYCFLRKSCGSLWNRPQLAFLSLTFITSQVS